MPTVPDLTLYMRVWCHLCDDMTAALAQQLPEGAYRLHQVDVDSDPALEARFGERIPVLVTGTPATPPEQAVELCHYFVDPQAVADWFCGAIAESVDLANLDGEVA